MKLTKFKVYFLAILLLLLAGCKASGNHRAPVEQRDAPSKRVNLPAKKPVQADQDTRPQIYVIQKGDTLYSIAFDNGLDYREVAEQNGIENPSEIQIGQKIKLIASDEVVSDRPRIEVKPLPPPVMISKKEQPKLIKLPYSENAVALVEKNLDESNPLPAVAVVSPPVISPIKEVDTGTDDGLDWGMPTKGKVIAEYSESANRKGIDIAGNKGQPVLASAAGKVVYSGSGLRGYGKLVIIKHNKTFLSAYAHNEQILVKEGQSVTKGQKIAEMGSSDADQVKLHFEIRKFGKPVDPSKFMSFTKS
jgi:lipoprotein NlpD